MPTLCITCDYDLQGLADTALCPECATPVARSTTDRRLRNADFNWLTRTTRGINWLERCIRFPIWAFIAFIAGSMALGMVALISTQWSITLGGRLSLIFTVACMIPFFLSMLLFTVGYVPFIWLATARSDHFTSPIDRWRITLRLTAWAPVLLVLLAAAQRLFAPMFNRLPAIAPDIALTVAVLVFAFHNFTFREALRTLALRTDDFTPKRRKRHARSWRSTAIAAVLLLALIWWPYTSPAGPTTANLRVVLLFAVIITIAFLHSPLKDTARALKEELRAASPHKLTTDPTPSPSPSA